MLEIPMQFASHLAYKVHQNNKNRGSAEDVAIFTSKFLLGCSFPEYHPTSGSETWAGMLTELSREQFVLFIIFMVSLKHNNKSNNL
jgi:hypothetical protein